MIINMNVPSMDSHRNMKIQGVKQALSSARLASGLRVNSAADDAAGLAISEKMRGQIRGLAMGSKNMADGQALCTTGDGGLDQISSMLIRIRELIVQAANDTNTLSDRENIQMEIDQLLDEIDQTAERVEYNTIKILSTPSGFISHSDNTVTTMSEYGTSSTTTDTVTKYEKYPRNTPPANVGDSITTTQPPTSATNNYTNASYSKSVTEAGKASNGRIINKTTEIWTTTETTEYLTQQSTRKLTRLENPESMAATDPRLVTAAGVPKFQSIAPTGVPQSDVMQIYGDTSKAVVTINGTNYVLYDENAGNYIQPPPTQTTGTSGTSSQTVTTWVIEGLEIRQTVSSSDNNDNYSILFYFRNVGGGSLDFSYKFVMDLMNTYGSGDTATVYSGADGSAATLTTNDVQVVISDWAGASDALRPSAVHGDIDNLFADDTAIPADPGSFKGHSGAAYIYNATLNAGGYVFSMMNYIVTYRNAYYMEEEITERTIGSDSFNETTERTVITEEASPALWIQQGANEIQGMWLQLADVRLASLLDTFAFDGAFYDLPKVSSHEICQPSLVQMDAAIAKVTDFRVNFGVCINRLEMGIRGVDISHENLSASESRIRDADMALEMMVLTKSNVLQQAATSMLTQANQLPQTALQLLR